MFYLMFLHTFFLSCTLFILFDSLQLFPNHYPAIVKKCIYLIIDVIVVFIKIVLHRLLGTDAGPNKVQEIKTDSLGNLPVVHRDEGMFLYGPPLISLDKKTNFEIVLNRPCSDTLNTAYR